MTFRTLSHRLRDRALDRPDAPFITWDDRTISYREADTWSRRIGAGLLRLDRDHGASGRVAVFLGNSPEAVLTWLGTQAVGLVPVTLNRAQRGLPLADMVHRSGAAVILTDEEGADILEVCDAVGERRLVLLAASDRRPALACVADVTEASPGDLVDARAEDDATIMFSSGTTGPSKGVVIPHGMFDAGSARLAATWDVGPDDVIHCWAPWFHIAAQMDVFGLAIHGGAAVALVDGFSLSRFWEQIRSSRATIFGGFVSVLELLHAAPASADDGVHCLRMGIAGHIPAALRQDFERRFKVTMVDLYGMSEAEPLTVPSVQESLPDGSAGRANPDFELQIQDESGTVLPSGSLGQIVFRPLRPHVMMSRYLDDPERTERAWRDGWFVTGDLGRMDDQGRLFFAERMSDFIRVGGENVSPQEVETVLIGHPAIREVGVVAVTSPLGENEIKAVIVLNEDADVGDLPRWCRDRMAKFMIPRHYEFVAALPRTPTSKIQRVLLRDARGPVYSADQFPDEVAVGRMSS